MALSGDSAARPAAPRQKTTLVPAVCERRTQPHPDWSRSSFGSASACGKYEFPHPREWRPPCRMGRAARRAVSPSRSMSWCHYSSGDPRAMPAERMWAIERGPMGRRPGAGKTPETRDRFGRDCRVYPLPPNVFDSDSFSVCEAELMDARRSPECSFRAALLDLFLKAPMAPEDGLGGTVSQVSGERQDSESFRSGRRAPKRRHSPPRRNH